MVEPLLDENLRSALCMKVWPVLGLDDGVEGGVSDFLASLAKGLAAAPKGFELFDESSAGLGG